jgi:1-acyl-sn-glycerol-3-phosphate acyltransferase
MSNHASLYDIPLIYAALPGSIRMIAKKELFRIPLWGYTTKKIEVLSIDRSNSAQAKLDLNYAKEKMRSGIVLWIAPEGTRSRHGKLNSFKKGGFILALETGATIIPVGIRGSDKILPPGTWHFGLNQKVEIHIGEPIDSTQYTLATRNEFIATVRQSILKAADVESV